MNCFCVFVCAYVCDLFVIGCLMLNGSVWCVCDFVPVCASLCALFQCVCGMCLCFLVWCCTVSHAVSCFVYVRVCFVTIVLMRGLVCIVCN